MVIWLIWFAGTELPVYPAYFDLEKSKDISSLTRLEKVQKIWKRKSHEGLSLTISAQFGRYI